ncbi:hypothetical protein FGB62_132g028 [Gracilaria domingensis]|nr:hypothetical protein FGB62_132g028 [Gracilaria domingensis]
MTRLLSTIVKGIDVRRQNKDIKQCNLEDINYGWVYTAHLASKHLQIGELSTKCYSELDDTDAVVSGLLPESAFDNSMEVIGNGVQALYEAISNITESPQIQGSGNWSNSFPLRGWRIGDDIQRCKVETFSAYRMGNNFFLRASMTNHQADKYVEDRNRHFVNEWVRDDFSQSLKMNHPSMEDGEVVCGTTLLEQWGARVWISWHGQMTDQDNPAVRRSSRQNEIAIDLAEDSISPANVAIITLPMVVNLIPLALIAELNTLGYLLYIIFTDIISVAPFMIKGIELVSATRSHPVLVAYYAGDEELADIQVWTADCRGTNRFRVIGWIFITVGAFFVILGIALEFIARSYVERRRKENEDFVGPFGKGVFDSIGTGILGAHFDLQSDCYSDYTSEFDSVDTMETGVGKAKTEDGSLEAQQSLRRFILNWISILTPSSPLGAWAGCIANSGPENSNEAGVGHDGLASAERSDEDHYEK